MKNIVEKTRQMNKMGTADIKKLMAFLVALVMMKFIEKRKIAPIKASVQIQ